MIFIQSKLGRKQYLRGIVLVVFFSAFLIFPLVSLHCRACDGPNDQYYFEDVNVLLIGRCRAIGSDGTWNGGLFIGEQLSPDISSEGTHFEGLRVLVYNTSIFNLYTSFSESTIVVSMRDATGVFFWGAKGFGVRRIPPIIFVQCHVEKVWVRFN